MVKETANVREVFEICRDQVALCKVKIAIQLDTLKTDAKVTILQRVDYTPLTLALKRRNGKYSFCDQDEVLNHSCRSIHCRCLLFMR